MSIDELNTERRLEQDTLSRNSGDVLQSIVENITDSIYTKNIDGCYTVANAGTARITGKSTAEIIGKNDTFLFPPAEAKKIMAADRAVMESRMSKTYEETVTMPNGEVRFFLSTKGPLIDRQGKILGVFGISRDISWCKKTETVLRQFVSQCPFAVCMLDTDMRYIITSNRWISDYGLKADEVLGRSHYEVFPETPEHWKILHRRCLAGAVEKRDEEAFRRADGTINWIRWEIRPWYKFDGKIGGILIYSEDITASKLAKDAQRNERQFLIDSQEVALVGSWALELPSYQLTWTEQSYRNFGVSSDTFALSAESFLGLIIPEDRDAMQEWMRACLEGENPGGLEFRVLDPDGAFRVLEGRGRLIYDYENQPVRMIGTNRDITENKHAELTLRKSEEQTRAIITTEPECVKILGPKGEIVEMNPAGLAMLEASSLDELQSHSSLVDFVLPEYRKSFLDLHRRVLGGENGVLEFEIIGLRGTRRWLETHAAPLGNSSGRGTMFLGVTRDITKHKQLELALVAAKHAAEEALKCKSAFIDIAAHELRTPVTAISLLIQLFQRQIEIGQSINSDILVRFREPVNRLTRLVVDLLDVSRLERGLVNLHPVRSDIVSLVSKCVEEFRLQAPKRRFTFTKPEQSIEINLDPSKIYQVLSNLLDNAVKYTDEDCSIEVTIEPLPEVIRISVIDHGAGIPQEQLGRLFAPLVRGSSAATIRTSGLGLGLSVCRGIVELHGGMIGVLSELGRGSTFYFELPRRGITA